LLLQLFFLAGVLTMLQLSRPFALVPLAGLVVTLGCSNSSTTTVPDAAQSSDVAVADDVAAKTPDAYVPDRYLMAVDLIWEPEARPKPEVQPVEVSGSEAAVGDPTAPVGSPVYVHGQLQVDGTMLKDADGNLVQLKGVSSMWLNWESRAFAESKDALTFMRDNWKLSVIRASMGTEASKGYLTGDTSKAAMLAKVESIIQNAIAVGVYVLVDWHTEKAVDQQTDSIAFFTGLAQKYGSYPNVIWEPYNEPNGYTWDKIKPYHEAVVDAIRSVDPDNVIVMGTPTWSQDVDIAAANPVAPTSGTKNLMYTLHFYACTHKQKLRDKANVALSKGLALFVTEFGATPSDGGVVSKGDNYVCRDATNDWWNWMSLNSISGVSWKLDQCTDTSCILTSAAPTNGPWTDDYLTTDLNNIAVSAGVTQGGGHGLFIVDWLRE
jgi:aryl-phospho-beta-D-glucosidase BglC (GH1 family)